MQGHLEGLPQGNPMKNELKNDLGDLHLVNLGDPELGKGPNLVLGEGCLCPPDEWMRSKVDRATSTQQGPGWGPQSH